MSTIKDQKFGMIGGDIENSWALENTDLNNFNLIDYINNADESDSDPIQYGSNEQDQKKRREDKAYTTQQYNQLMFNDFQQMRMQNNASHFENQSYENQYPSGVANFIGSNGNGNRGVLGQNHGYGNVDPIMIPTTSKSAMPMPIKIEPDFGHEQQLGKHFDDSGHYSDADSYAHSIGSVGAYDGGLFHPKTKPRKYRVKPYEERQNPVYKIKREKNNDAVRRSRDKAKRIQLEKDERLTFLEQETQMKDRTIQQLKAEIEKSRQIISMFQRNCSCGASTRF